MAKTNFTKAEEAFDKERDKLLKARLLEEADLASGKVTSSDQKQKKLLLIQLQRDIKTLRKDKTIFSKIEKPFLHEILKEQEKFLSRPLDEIQTFQAQIATLKAAFNKRHPPLKDEAVIEKEIEKHINKRFNIKDDWLPLH